MSKKIYLTVDTECHDIKKLNSYISGKTQEGVFGLEKILQLGQELNVPINVFLDIPECHKYGDEYILSWIELVKRYNQPIFLHVHPDYIADPSRKHLWEYTKDEQKKILKQAIDDYIRFCGEQNKIFFRAGAWGVNSDTYEVLSELLPDISASEIVDLSYVYQSRWRCHLSAKEYGAANACKKYKDIMVFPNTTYIGLDYFGKQYAFELCVPNPNFGEFKKVIDQNQLDDITYTMHSWDFIKRWFFLPDTIKGNKKQIRTFKKCVEYAKKKGYEFSRLEEIDETEKNDQCINLCRGLWGKIVCIWYNYRRFADTGRSYKKYAILYFAPWILLVLFLTYMCVKSCG